MQAVNDVLIRQIGRAGRITLQRTAALNALSHEMALAIDGQLSVWAEDDAIDIVVIDAEGEKAFCAGGDIQDLYEQGVAGDFESGAQFWRDEYQLNARIAGFPKPVVAIMQGITMGGGVGLACHASHRVVTETTRIALPECSIGLVPDVGSTHLLARAPGHLGEFLALTGYRMNGEDAVFCGFADHLVAETKRAALVSALEANADPSIIAEFARPVEAAKLAPLQSDISEIFSADGVTAIQSRLAELQNDWAETALKKIQSASPISLSLALTLVRSARQLPGVNPALTREFRIVSRAMEHGDFIEGIRAAIIERGATPDWAFSSVDDVPAELIDLFQSEAECGDAVFTKAGSDIANEGMNV